jgi:hypothetical protein
MGYGTSLVLGLNRTAMTLPAAYLPLRRGLVWRDIMPPCRRPSRWPTTPEPRVATDPRVGWTDDEFGRLVDITREMSEP